MRLPAMVIAEIQDGTKTLLFYCMPDSRFQFDDFFIE